MARILNVGVSTMSLRATLAVLILTVPAAVRAQPAALEDDGYCDYVEGTAAANAATLIAPELFGQVGYIEQPTFATLPVEDPSNLRVIGGVRYSLTNIYAGSVTKARARAECRRHKALQVLQGAAEGLTGLNQALRAMTRGRALTARGRVVDEALPEAERILKELQVQLDARQTTAQSAMATRMRVEELRELSAVTKRELAELPPVPEQKPLSSLFSDFQSADAEVERQEAKLRTIRAYDLSIRGGVDRFLEGATQETRYFAVVELGVNLGALLVGSGNKRSKLGRKRYAASQTALFSKEEATNLAQVRAALEIDSKRVEQLTALAGELDAQYKALANTTSEESKRFRETVWFDLVKARAELAFLQAHVQAVRELLGEQAKK
jgi:hypothetical protein